MIVLLSGLSGVGKTTLATNVKSKLIKDGISVEVIDGDDYRKTLCSDLGFSKEDRIENIRRLGEVADIFSSQGIISIVSAINPYNEIRKELQATYNDVKVIHLDCKLNTLIGRDTKGLYKRALLPENHVDKLSNLTGVNDNFDVPLQPDLYINTDESSIPESTLQLYSFIKLSLSPSQKNYIHQQV